MLYSERTTSRAHWSHPGPRRWAEDRALASIHRSQATIEAAGKELVAGALAPEQGSLFSFLLVNPGDYVWEGLVYSELAPADGPELPLELQIARQGGEAVPCQLMKPACGSHLLVFPASVSPRRPVRFSLRSSQADARALLQSDPPAPGQLVPVASGQRKHRAFHQSNPRAPEQTHSGAFDEPATDVLPQCGLKVDALDGAVVRLANDLVAIELDMGNGGYIRRFLDRRSGTRIMSRSNFFLGEVFLGRDAEERDLRHQFITDEGRAASWETIASGPLVAAVRVRSELLPGVATRCTEYFLEGGSPILRIATGTYFTKPVWFASEYDRCARIVFEPTLGSDQTVQWRMPGGALAPREVPETWCGFDTMGWAHVYDDTRGLAIVVKLYPNGPRMFCLRHGILSMAVSGVQPIGPYYTSAASLGSQSYEFLLVPTEGSGAGLEGVYQMLNKPPFIISDQADHTPIILRRPDENPSPYGEERLSEEVWK